MIQKQKIDIQHIRRSILKLLAFIPDKLMLRVQYRIKTGKVLHLKNPLRYTEKIQLYKLAYRDPLMTICADKWLVRKYIKEKGFEDILTKLFFVWDKAEEIVFDRIPDCCVIKKTNGGGGLNVFIRKKRDDITMDELMYLTRKWLKPPKAHVDGREWVYDKLQSRVICEELLVQDGGLVDYKFFCFFGKVFCVYVISNRVLGESAELAIMDCNFKRLSVQSNTQKVMLNTPSKPKNFDKMIEIAEELSVKFPHVRVDLYNIDGRIVFGELTFFGASGYQSWSPESFDYIMGAHFDVSCMKTERRHP